MIPEEIIQSILDIPAETQTIEFKRLGGYRNDIAPIVEAIVAMMNAEGGLLVLGVDDPEKTILKGLARVFGIEESIDNFDALGRELQRIVPPIPRLWPP